MVSSAFSPAHDDHAASNFALTIQIGNPAPHLWPDLDARDIAQPHRYASVSRHQRNLAEVVQRLQITEARTMYSASPNSSTEPPVS
jgi:hypothetical protein